MLLMHVLISSGEQAGQTQRRATYFLQRSILYHTLYGQAAEEGRTESNSKELDFEICAMSVLKRSVICIQPLQTDQIYTQKSEKN